MTQPSLASRNPGLEAIVRRHLPELALSDGSLKISIFSTSRV